MNNKEHNTEKTKINQINDKSEYCDWLYEWTNLILKQNNEKQI